MSMKVVNANANNKNLNLVKRDRILGALYGFAIGDAMGATTEFLSKNQIKKEYGVVNDLIGGGWLNTKAGEVTDDTQMMLCVADALMSYPDNSGMFKKTCIKNFVGWYDTEPKDIGNQCRKAIEHYVYYYDYIPFDASALGNGSLMRALPCALLGKSKFNVEQGVLTHNNKECSDMIREYTRLIHHIINDRDYDFGVNTVFEPTGYILNTFNNAVYWSTHSDTFADAVINAVNDGGDADTIAAITGSIAGAMYGYKCIPKHWVEKIDSTVDYYLKKFRDFVFGYLQLQDFVL